MTPLNSLFFGNERIQRRLIIPDLSSDLHGSLYPGYGLTDRQAARLPFSASWKSRSTVAASRFPAIHTSLDQLIGLETVLFTAAIEKFHGHAVAALRGRLPAKSCHQPAARGTI
jgi:hypothetical protein